MPLKLSIQIIAYCLFKTTNGVPLTTLLWALKSRRHDTKLQKFHLQDAINELFPEPPTKKSIGRCPNVTEAFDVDIADMPAATIVQWPDISTLKSLELLRKIDSASTGGSWTTHNHVQYPLQWEQGEQCGTGVSTFRF